MSDLAQAQHCEITQADWTFVQSLLHDLQAEEDREEIASLFGQWRLSIKAFRRVEERRMIRQSPDDVDLLCHKMCVTNLMSFGSMLLIRATDHADCDLIKHGLRKDVIEALVQDLHNTLDEWHGQIPNDRIDALQRQIFDAPTGANREDSRTQI